MSAIDALDRDISRRELYAMGEPLGDGATRRKLGGGYICGIGGKSKSSSSTTTNNADNRVAVQGGFGLSSSDGNTFNVTDGGIVSRALDSVDLSGANLGAGYQSLISAATSIFNDGQGLIGQTQKSVADAYSMAKTDANGGIDQKTIIVLAVAGAVALYAIKSK